MVCSNYVIIRKHDGIFIFKK